MDSIVFPLKLGDAGSKVANVQDALFTLLERDFGIPSPLQRRINADRLAHP